MPFKIIRNDITQMSVDAVVNTANVAPTFVSGVDAAIYKAAGEEDLLAARREIGYLEPGQVAITDGYALPAKYIIHAVSPLYIDGEHGEDKILRRCYARSLKLAAEHGCKSIAFPLISTGAFGYPKEEGMRIALDEINAFLMHEPKMMIYLVVFDTESTFLAKALYPELEAYINHNYVVEKRQEEYGDGYFGSVPKGAPGYEAYARRREELERELEVRRQKKVHPIEAPEILSPQQSQRVFNAPATDMDLECSKQSEDSYEDFLDSLEKGLGNRMAHMSDTFQQYLFYLIEQKGLTNVSVYKRAILDKRVFSKIKKNKNYHPDKATALRLCVGAMLNIDETKDLLARAGYALSPCDKRDIIFSFFIEKGVYDVLEIDIVLEEHGLPCFIY